ncbi:sporulation protein YabP [Paramaledivibacter caminithermalis]|jgi:sporulation protein YabP|uniref:Sporulation protein YabP n=1 Tax=Paramaledivibacter caminithermalis (strain DSM 15212 / CIP 107654 / DViRD3) TaxID=1121301 RepID=A0A1M6QN23_PARC5|nr:sporulation protein YabP [Paramaledivibacter caminithermalis]SHK21662.1 sporulation protein YabP [Paramaledivibacter caminithermalis DSM 15212]
MEERKNVSNRSHNVILENREKMSISGVEHVKSFDPTIIILITVQGNITIRGSELDIKKLNLDDGNLSIEGYINSIVYSDKEDIGSKGIGFLGKIFK